MAFRLFGNLIEIVILASIIGAPIIYGIIMLFKKRFVRGLKVILVYLALIGIASSSLLHVVILETEENRQTAYNLLSETFGTYFAQTFMDNTTIITVCYFISITFLYLLVLLFSRISRSRREIKMLETELEALLSCLEDARLHLESASSFKEKIVGLFIAIEEAKKEREFYSRSVDDEIAKISLSIVEIEKFICRINTQKFSISEIKDIIDRVKHHAETSSLISEKVKSIYMKAEDKVMELQKQKEANIIETKRKEREQLREEDRRKRIGEKERKEKETKMAYQEMIGKAESGDINAQYNLGTKYRKGDGVTKDYIKAKEWYAKAAEQGHSESQFELGYFHFDSENYSEAVKWFTKAAEQGHSDSQNYLGYMYSLGQGVVPQDYSESAKWYTKAAEQGHAEAQTNLAMMYVDSENYEEAAKWLMKASEQGVKEAQFNLGSLYFSGRGLTQNYSEAAKWFTKASDGEMGLPEAQSRLGLLYLKGEGVEQNDKKALEWFDKAARQGDKNAEEMIELLNKNLRKADYYDDEYYDDDYDDD